MSHAQETLDGVKNRFLARPEDVCFLVRILTELESLIENTNAELNRGLENAMKKLF